MIAGLLLAAGRSARFGGDKLLAPLHGRPVLFWSAVAMAKEVDALYVVVPSNATPRIDALDGMSAIVVQHARSDDGMASSIAAGIAALSPDVEAVVIALADQPLISPSTTRRLCERWRAGGTTAVTPRYRDGRGHPVLFGRAAFHALATLEGDTGARAVLDALGDEVAQVAVDASIPVDVDTPEALRALAAIWRA